MAGTERLSLLIESRTTGEPDVNKLADSINRLSDSVGKVNQQPLKPPAPELGGFEKFSAGVKQFVQDPMGAAGDAVEGFLKTLGPMGTGVLTGAAVLGVISKEALGAAESLASYGAQIQNVALRTGLSAKEVGQFSFAAKMANQDVTVFESAMRKLSQGLEDNTDAGKKARQGLVDVGVTAYDSTGKLRPMSDIFVQISEGLSRIEDPAKRDSEALKIFGKSGIELIPTMVGLADNLARAKQIGLGPSDEDVKRWEGYHQTLVTAEAVWDRFARKVKEPLAAVLTVTLKGISGDTSDIGESMVNALKGRIPKLTPEAAYDLLEKAGESGFVGGAQYRELEELIKKQGDPRVGAAFHTGLHIDLSSLYSPINSALAPMGEKGDLEDARKKLAELQGNLQKLKDLNAPLSQQREAADGVLVQKRKIEGLEAEAKATRDLATEKQHLLELDKRSREIYATSAGAGNGEFGRLYAQRGALEVAQADDLRKAGNNPAMRGRVIADYALQFAANTNDIDGALKKWRQALDSVLSDAPELDVQKIIKANAEKRMQENGGDFFAYNPGLFANSITPPAGWTSPQLAIRNARDNERRSLGLFSAQASLYGMSEGDQTSGAYALRKKLADDEYAALIRIADLKGTQEEKEEARAEAEDQRHQKLFDAQMERDQALLQIAARQKEAFQSAVVGGFDALIAGGFAQFLKSQGRGMVDKVIGNAAGAAWGDVSKIIPHSSGFLGKLLQGTPFGPDPSKAATDANTLATIDNTAALRTMALSASGGGGGSVSGAASVLSRLYSSGSAGIDSGYTSDGVQKYSPENYDSSGQFLGAGATSSHDPSIHAGAVGTSALGKGVGYAAAIAAGGFGIYHGIEQGGLSGAASATGSAASMAAGIMTIAGVTGPAAPILMGVGLGLALLPSLFGDPKQKRASDLDSDRQQRLFTMPTGQDYSMDARGRYTDYDYQGNTRTVVVNNNVYAMDSVSLRDYLVANPGALSAGMASAIQGGNAEDTVGVLQQRLQ